MLYLPRLTFLLTRRQVPGGKKADRLQLDVDPKLLVSSKSRGPAPQCHIPTHAPQKRKVCLHHASRVASCLTICTHLHSQQKASASQQLPLEMEKAGGKRARSASPSSARQTRSTQKR